MVLLEQAKTPTMHVPEWHARIGVELTATLVRLGVLVEAEPAPWYPCGGAFGDGCPRNVVANRGCASHPFVAVCGRDDTACVEVLLRAEERSVLRLSLDGLVRQLRRALSIAGPIERDVTYPDSCRMGEIAGRSVFLALSPALPGFDAWLATRGDAVVLVPAARGVPLALRERFAVGQRVELVVLRELLRLQDGALAGALKERSPSPPPEALVTESVRPVVCLVIDQDGQRFLTADQYQALVASCRDLDLFLDATVAVDGGGHRAIRRDDDGRAEETVLTKHEAAAVAELVSTRRALRAGDFKTLSVNAIDKVIERARSKLDVRKGRYRWRAIHTLAAETHEAKRWRFAPDAGLRFAIALPA